MYGDQMGTLQVLTVGDAAPVPIWSKAGDQGNEWHMSPVIDVFASKIHVTSCTGGDRSDMAIDDFEVACFGTGNGDAGELPLFAPVPPAAPPPDTLGPGEFRITWTPGSYDYETSWTLLCGGKLNLAHQGAWEDSTATYTAAVGETCTLTLEDSYGDGWNGAAISLFGNTYTLGTGSTATFKFVTTVIAWTTGSYDQECTFTLTCSSFTVGPHALDRRARTTSPRRSAIRLPSPGGHVRPLRTAPRSCRVRQHLHLLPYGVSSEDFPC